MENWDAEIKSFLVGCIEQKVRLILVGGGAVNFHGYQRHSADVDFWLDPDAENMDRLVRVFQQMGFSIDDVPAEVRQQQQNISIKFSPEQPYIELITRFALGKAFDQAWKHSKTARLRTDEKITYQVLDLEDLIENKTRAARPKDLLDIQELKRLSEDR
jgi:DNA modification methylase